MDEALGAAKAALVEELRALGYDDEALRALSKVIARFTAAVVKIEVTRRNAQVRAEERRNYGRALAALAVVESTAGSPARTLSEVLRQEGRRAAEGGAR